MEAVANGVIALQKVRRSVDAASEILRIDTGKSVGLASVAANAEEFWMLLSHRKVVRGKVGDCVIIRRISLVPIVWERLMAGCVLEIRVVAGNGIKRFENIACEETFGVLGRLVSHESVNESPSGRRNYDAGEGSVEEVWVVADGLLEAGSAVVGEYLEVDAVAVLLTEFVQCGKLRDLDQIVVTTVSGLVLEDPDGLHARTLLFIEVTTSGRYVSLVFVVGA